MFKQSLIGAVLFTAMLTGCAAVDSTRSVEPKEPAFEDGVAVGYEQGKMEATYLLLQVIEACSSFKKPQVVTFDEDKTLGFLCQSIRSGSI